MSKDRTRLSFTLKMAWRFVVSKNSGLSRFTNWVALIGLVLGLTLLVVVLSVFNGFTSLYQESFFEVAPHAVVHDQIDYDEVTETLQEYEEVSTVEPFIELQVLLRSGAAGRATTTTNLFGFDENSSNPLYRRTLGQVSTKEGVAPAAMDPEIIRILGLNTGDSIIATAPVITDQGISTRTAVFQLANERYDLRLPDEYGDSLMLVRLSDLISQGVINAKQVNHRVTVSNPLKVDQIIPEFSRVTTWVDQYGSLFSAIRMEKTITFVMLLFAVALAALNLVSSQATLINRKSGDIAILQTMGAEMKWIKWVFTLHGMTIVVLGTAVGIGLGLLVANYAMDMVNWFVERVANDGGRLLGPGININYVIIKPVDLIWASVASLCIGFLAVLRPLSLLSKSDPVEALNRIV